MKTILILGASSDIGMAYMRRLEETHQPGEARVIAHYRTMSSELSTWIAAAKHVPIDPVEADLGLSGDVARLIVHVRDTYEAPTHILHLAASPFRHMRLREFDSETVQSEMQIQVLSLGEILKAFLPVMAKRGYGKVAIMLTAYTLGVPPKFVADYAICKYALLGLMKAAAAEYGDKGVCVNGLSPSMIETKFLDKINHRIVEMSAAESPLKRNVTVAEVVEALAFLQSNENGYMSGVNLNLSGGAR